MSPYEIHLNRDWNSNVPHYDADIALLKFLKIHFTNHVQPICLWNLDYVPSATVGTVVGWGEGENKTRTFENIPRMIEVPIVSNENCWFEDHELIQISSLNTFCAGLKNGAGICFGDSGSGYVIKNGRSYYLRGIVSSSASTDTNECDVTRYAIYTDVLKYSAWIQTFLEAHDFSNQGTSGKSISVKEACSNRELYCKHFGCASVALDQNLPEYETQIGEFPEAAALYFIKSYDGRATIHNIQNGVLINEWFILTTAKSLKDEYSVLQFAWLGAVS